MANRIVLNETSYHGKGAIREIASEAISRGFKKAFICSDPDLIKFGVTGKVTKVLEDAGLVYEIYKAMYYQLSLVAIQICVVGFISHRLVLLTLSLYFCFISALCKNRNCCIHHYNQTPIKSFTFFFTFNAFAYSIRLGIFFFKSFT